MDFLILDFSQYSLSEILSQNFIEKWQVPIKDFLEGWTNEKDFLEVKTSGSTGKPKLFNYPKLAFVQSAEMTGEYLRLQQGNSALLCLPTHYIAGKMMLIRAISLKLKLYCIEPKSEIKLNQNFDFSAMTPMQVEKSIHSISKIKKLLIGGTQISFDLSEKLKFFSTEIYETFGMTETLSHIAMNSLNFQRGIFEVLPRIKIKTNENNCLIIKTPYFDDEIETNDIVELIDDKHFIWKGRLDNVINSGGIKLFPEEIEQKLKPFIDDEFYISSQKNELLGEELILIIKSTETVFDETIFNLAELNKFEIPKKIIFKNEFIYTKSGKIIRDIF